MPIYEYSCSACGNAFEALVLSTDARPECEHCGSGKVEKQLSTFSPAVSAGLSSPCADMGCGRAGTGCARACPSE